MILVDNRRGSKELNPLLHSTSKLTTLQYGDVAFMGKWAEGKPASVGIERKAISDLASSIASGRLSGHQLRGMLNKYTHTWVLVEGIWKIRESDGVLVIYRGGKWIPLKFGQRTFYGSNITKYLINLQCTCNVNIWQTADKKQSAMWIDHMYKWWQKNWEDHTAHMAFHNITFNEPVQLIQPKLVSRVAKEIPGVGLKRGLTIGKYFNSVLRFILATPEQLQQVPGIGKGIAKNIYDSIRKENGE